MDVNKQIEILKKEHEAAIDKFDFDKAESISIQIQKLQKAITNSNQKLDPFLEEAEKIKASENATKTKYTQERIELQRKFHERFEELTKNQTTEMNNLTLSYSLAREREQKRPVHEAELKYEQAKSFGTAHNYDLAKAVYQDGVRLEKKARQRRLDQCEENFLKQKEKLEAKHKKETDLLMEKQRSALQELELRASKEHTRLNLVENVAKTKSSLKKRDVPKVSGVLSPKKRSHSSVSTKSPDSARRYNSYSRGSFLYSVTPY